MHAAVEIEEEELPKIDDDLDFHDDIVQAETLRAPVAPVAPIAPLAPLAPQPPTTFVTVNYQNRRPVSVKVVTRVYF